MGHLFTRVVLTSLPNNRRENVPAEVTSNARHCLGSSCTLSFQGVRLVLGGPFSLVCPTSTHTRFRQGSHLGPSWLIICITQTRTCHTSASTGTSIGRFVWTVVVRGISTWGFTASFTRTVVMRCASRWCFIARIISKSCIRILISRVSHKSWHLGIIILNSKE